MPSVGCELVFDLAVDSVLALQVAALDPIEERFDTTASIEEVPTSGSGRIHVVRAAAGLLAVSYAATANAMAAPVSLPASIDEASLTYRRQSRYCPSDELEGFVGATFDDDATPFDIATWVFERLAYEAGSSRPQDTAIDTLLASRGVCRDYAHLTVALCRAMGFPARLSSVYAPGLEPMDFHAIAEVRTAWGWEVHDATRLAPTESMVRICTGRDAADTAFASTVSGDATFVSAIIRAEA